MFKEDWEELVSQVEAHGPERVILRDSEAGIDYEVDSVKWDNSEEMIIVNIAT
jgi:hypothetical protein